MSIQSMFNQMIGTIGVQSSILKNRLRPTEEGETPTAEKTKPQNASESPQKAVPDTSKAEPAKDKAETIEVPKTASGGSKVDKRKKYQAISTGEYKAYLKNKKLVENQKNQISALQERIKMLEGGAKK